MPEILREPVRGPSAWTCAEIEADGGWTHRFSDRELAEIAAALDAVRSRGLQVGRFGRDEFSLPTLSATIAAMVQEVEVVLPVFSRETLAQFRP
jgi:GGDEF domain-containing protein